MGYFLNAFIGQPNDFEKVKERFKSARIILLIDRIALLPMTSALFNEVNNNHTDNSIGKFEFMTTDVESEILNIIGASTVSYVEIEYFGGEGGQSGIIWRGGNRVFEKQFEQGVVNEILRQFGVVRSKLYDEFDTVGLGRHRSTEGWINEVS